MIDNDRRDDRKNFQELTRIGHPPRCYTACPCYQYHYAGLENRGLLEAARADARCVGTDRPPPCYTVPMNRIQRFLPGDGQSPPHLAGREAEQALLRKYLGWLQGREPIPRNVALLGPRGNGKTVLLRWFEREVLATNEVDVAWLTPNRIPDLDKLANALMPPGRFKEVLPDTLSLSIGVGKMGWNLGGQAGALTDLLTARCRHKPLAVLLDEAHNLDKDVGQALLNTSQEVRDKAPFLLVLAGTPGLSEHLNSMSATFWSRCEELGIGRLSRAATGEALTGPADKTGALLLRLTREALDAVVTESQCYPYFIQLWGEALWEQAQEVGPAPLDRAAVDRARPAVVKRQERYYQHRYAELDNTDLLEAAVAVATAFDGHRTLGHHQLNQAITVAVADKVRMKDTRRALRELGYIWQAPGCRDWEPGVPSLMDYVRAGENVAPPPASAPTLPGPG